MEQNRPINVWYVSGLSLCNFDCPYCASGQPSKGTGRTIDREWENENAPRVFQKTLKWLRRQPYQIGLRLQTIGEPFVSWTFLEGAAAMTNSENIRFVELVTNASLLSKRLPKLINEYKASPEKLSLWATYHHTEISAEKFIDQIRCAQDLGVEVIVNSLLFPDNAEKIINLKKRCSDHDIQMNVDLGYNNNEAYPFRPYIPILHDNSSEALCELDIDINTQLAAITAWGAPRGLQCSAGHDYIHIMPNGDVFPCRGYRVGGPRTKLGSALDKRFSLSLRAEEYHPCGLDKGCICKEDFLHLNIARGPKHNRRTLGLGYDGNPIKTDIGEMHKRLQQVGDTKLLKTLSSMPKP